jgi:hypothetical protein
MFHPSYRFGFVARACSTKRRIASEREGLSSCIAAHSSTALRSFGESRMAVTGSCPVAGLPGRFLGVDLGIVIVLR